MSGAGLKQSPLLTFWAASACLIATLPGRMRWLVRALVVVVGLVAVGAVAFALLAPRPVPARLSRPFVTMPDGVRLAVDVVLPLSLPAPKIPAVLIQTRYWRSLAVRGPAQVDVVPHGPREPIVEKLVQAGLAVVVADVRGTGASEGTWTRPWSQDERSDSRALLDWIVAQPWCNGAVATTGTSYEGTTALLTATTGHPALKAVLAREIEWDLVDELLAPGGVRNVGFVAAWSRSVAALDRGRPAEFFPALARLAITGVPPTDDDPTGAALAARLAQRRVTDVEALVAGVRAPSDPLGADQTAASHVGPLGHAEALRASPAAISIWGSWWDGATADAVLRAEQALPRAQLVIGPWTHEGDASASPLGDTAQATVALDDVVRFLADSLAGRDAGVASRRWYVAGAGQWAQSAAFPKPASVGLYLDAAGALVSEPPQAFEARVAVDFGATTGARTRWTTGLRSDVRYPPRVGQKGVTQWESAPLDAPQRWFGAPTFRCGVSLDGPDAALHVYLERVRRGRADSLTEGVARIQSGVADVRLRPVAALLSPGDSVRVSVAGADQGTFERVPATGPRTIVLRSQIGAVCLVTLPLSNAPAP